MARRSSGGCGFLILILVIIGICLGSAYGAVVWWTMGGLTILGIVLAAVSSTPQKCELCGNPIKKANYTFTHEGKSMTICVNCNRRIESKKSKEAVDALFNKGK